MAHHLVVTQEFGAYAIGQKITDAAEVEAISAEHPGRVVRVLADDSADLAPPPEVEAAAPLAAPPSE
jgi:hypothetical protein